MFLEIFSRVVAIFRYFQRRILCLSHMNCHMPAGHSIGERKCPEPPLRGLPRIYPEYTLSLPWVYPEFTQSLPGVYPKFTRSLPRFYPSASVADVFLTNWLSKITHFFVILKFITASFSFSSIQFYIIILCHRSYYFILFYVKLCWNIVLYRIGPNIRRPWL